MIKIDVCIATFKRSSLRDCLISVAAQKLPNNVFIRIIVADNDRMPSASKLVAEVQQEISVPIAYLHAPERNISIARNACLEAVDADFAAFIDDDEVADPNWLSALLKAVSGNSAVFGPALARYPEGAPGWMVKEQYHDNLPVVRGGEVQTGHTCNALVRMTDPSVQGQKFDLALGRSGGEDTAYFFNIFHRGGRFAIAEDALVFENVTPSRLSFGWLMRRKFRAGQTYALEAAGKNLARKAAIALFACFKVIFCAVMGVVFCWSEERRYFWALRGALHCGVVAAFFGRKGLQIY